MIYEMDAGTAARATEYFTVRLGKHLRRKSQKASFATYAFGLMADGERKSVEPIAAGRVPEVVEIEMAHPFA